MEPWIWLVIFSMAFIWMGGFMSVSRPARGVEDSNSPDVATKPRRGIFFQNKGENAATRLAKLDDYLASARSTLGIDPCVLTAKWNIENATANLSQARSLHRRGRWQDSINEANLGLLHVQVALATVAEYNLQRQALSGKSAVLVDGAGEAKPANLDPPLKPEDYCDVGNPRVTASYREWQRLGMFIGRAKALLAQTPQTFPEYVDVYMDLTRAEDLFKAARSARDSSDVDECISGGVFFVQLAIEIADNYLIAHGTCPSFAPSPADALVTAPVASASVSNSTKARTAINAACRGILLAGEAVAHLADAPTGAKFHLHLALNQIALAKTKLADKKFGAARYEAAQSVFHATLARDLLEVHEHETADLKQGQQSTINEEIRQKPNESVKTGYRLRQKGQVEWRSLALAIVKMEALLAVRYPDFADKAGVIATAHSFDIKADQVDQWDDVPKVAERGLKFIETAVRKIEASGPSGSVRSA